MTTAAGSAPELGAALDADRRRLPWGMVIAVAAAIATGALLVVAPMLTFGAVVGVVLLVVMLLLGRQSASVFAIALGLLIASLLIRGEKAGRESRTETARPMPVPVPAEGNRAEAEIVSFLAIFQERGRLIAGIVYHNWDPDAEIIEMSGAATDPRWLTRATLARMYRYAFHECGCQMTVMRVPADNERLLRQLAALNYAFIRIPRLLGRDHDGVLGLLTQEAWAANKFCRRFHHDVRPEPDKEAA